MCPHSSNKLNLYSCIVEFFQNDWYIEATSPPPDWPDKGDITFDGYSTRYRSGLDLVLKDISFEIPGGQKVLLHFGVLTVNTGYFNILIVDTDNFDIQTDDIEHFSNLTVYHVQFLLAKGPYQIMQPWYHQCCCCFHYYKVHFNIIIYISQTNLQNLLNQLAFLKYK